MSRPLTQYEKHNRRLRLKTYIRKTLLYTLIMQSVIFVVWFAVHSVSNAIQPPEIPVVVRTVATPAPIQTPMWSPFSLRPQEANSDESTDYDLSMEAFAYIEPMIAEFAERKPMFFTFLIFGLTEGLNANTIMVAAYDAEAGKGYVISIPRDTRVDVRRNNRKIVAAYNVGRLNGGEHEGGVARLKYEVQTLLGFRPDFYVRIDYEAFIRVVDAVGGVEVYVPFHMRYDDPCQDLHIDIPAGLQVLDGEDALRFARYRRGNDPRQNITDYQRIEHQQQVINSIFTGLQTPRTILRIPEFISIFNNYFSSDLSYGELLWFANQGRSFLGGSDYTTLEFHTIHMRGTSGAPHWYELADARGVLELVNRTVNPYTRDRTANDVRIVS